MHGGKWLNSEHKKCNERTCNTLRVTLAPNHTSPATLRLSSSIMLGIDLNRLKKLATCQEEKKIKNNNNKRKKLPRILDYQILFYLLKFWPQFDRRICRICSSWISDDKAINYSVKIRLQKRQSNELSESQTLHQDPMTVT